MKFLFLPVFNTLLRGKAISLMAQVFLEAAAIYPVAYQVVSQVGSYLTGKTYPTLSELPGEIFRRGTEAYKARFIQKSIYRAPVRLNTARFSSHSTHRVLAYNAKIGGLPGTRRVSTKAKSSRKPKSQSRPSKRPKHSKSSRPTKRRSTK